MSMRVRVVISKHASEIQEFLKIFRNVVTHRLEPTAVPRDVFKFSFNITILVVHSVTIPTLYIVRACLLQYINDRSLSQRRY